MPPSTLPASHFVDWKDYSYPAAATEHLDLQLRSTAALALNAFWPQNYVTDAAQGTLTLDQMVVATSRIGCTR